MSYIQIAPFAIVGKWFSPQVGGENTLSSSELNILFLKSEFKHLIIIFSLKLFFKIVFTATLSLFKSKHIKELLLEKIGEFP